MRSSGGSLPRYLTESKAAEECTRVLAPVVSGDDRVIEPKRSELDM